MKVSSSHGFVFMLLLWWASSQCSAVEMQAPTRPYEIPIEHRYAFEFARFLEKAGLTIEKIQGSHLAAMFENLHEAAFVTTNKGIVQVVFLAGEQDAEKIRVIAQTVYSQEPSAPYKYRIEGHPTVNQPEAMQAAEPLYFTTYKRWFIVATGCELDTLIKRACTQ
ncbi:MAG: hypothetical protein AB1898_32670 [Acidobacteriota bacterium]